MVTAEVKVSLARVAVRVPVTVPLLVTASVKLPAQTIEAGSLKSTTPAENELPVALAAVVVFVNDPSCQVTERLAMSLALR